MFTLVEWPERMKIHPSLKIDAHLATLETTVLSRVLDEYVRFLKDGEFAEASYRQVNSVQNVPLQKLMKLLDLREPANLLESSDIYERLKIVEHVPAILRVHTQLRADAPQQELVDLLINAIVIVVCGAQQGSQDTLDFASTSMDGEC